MEPLGSLLITAAGYILKSAAKSKTAAGAKEDVLGRFWQWIRPKVLKGVPEIEEKPEAPETEEKTQTQLLELIEDETFFNELVKRVDELQAAGIKEKNIVHGDIRRVKRIKIGDKEFAPDDPFDRKNIVLGSVEDADEFTLGDGH